MKIIKTANLIQKEAKKKSKNWKYNPWAVCRSVLNTSKKTPKMERCIHHIKDSKENN